MSLPVLPHAEAPEPEPPREPIALDEEERELVGLELQEVGPVSSPERQRAYDALAAAVVTGSVPPELVPLLERVVAISLESGRARRRYLAEGETILTGLFRRTPSGRELQESLNGVNKALEVLRGRTIQDVKVSLRTLGHIRMVLDTEDVSVTLSVRPSAVLIESVAVTGAGE